jgi:hypothetical protein
MSKQIEAMNLALKALITASGHVNNEDFVKVMLARDALVEALAEQPAREARRAQTKAIFAQSRTVLEAPVQPLTEDMVTAAARALNKRQAEACGVDKNDHWKFYGDDIKEDARAVLEAAHGITKGNT